MTNPAASKKPRIPEKIIFGTTLLKTLWHSNKKVISPHKYPAATDIKA